MQTEYSCKYSEQWISHSYAGPMPAKVKTNNSDTLLRQDLMSKVLISIDYHPSRMVYQFILILASIMGVWKQKHSQKNLFLLEIPEGQIQKSFRYIILMIPLCHKILCFLLFPNHINVNKSPENKLEVSDIRWKEGTGLLERR